VGSCAEAKGEAQGVPVGQLLVVVEVLREDTSEER
jgi:hypothetical protein